MGEPLRRYSTFLAVSLLAFAASADIPDHSRGWDGYALLEECSVERMLGFPLCGDEKTVRCLLLCESGGLAVAEAVPAGDGPAPTLEVIGMEEAGGWLGGCMLGYDRVAAVRPGEHGRVFLTVFDSEGMRAVGLHQLEGAPVEEGRAKYLAMEPLRTGAIAMAGVIETDSGAAHFLLAADTTGKIEWTTRLPADMAPETGMVLCPLDDGGCAAAVSGSPPSQTVSVHRIGASGEILWSRMLEVESDCTVRLNRLAAMDDGGVLCMGEKRIRGQRVHGLLILLGSDGGEAWRIEPWYLDHSALMAVLTLPEGGLLLEGWMALGGGCPMDVGERDVMLAFLDPVSMDLVGTRLERAGGQVPCAAIPRDDGTVLVLGIDGDAAEGSRLFAGVTGYR